MTTSKEQAKRERRQFGRREAAMQSIRASGKKPDTLSAQCAHILSDPEILRATGRAAALGPHRKKTMADFFDHVERFLREAHVHVQYLDDLTPDHMDVVRRHLTIEKWSESRVTNLKSAVSRTLELIGHSDVFVRWNNQEFASDKLKRGVGVFGQLRSFPAGCGLADDDITRLVRSGRNPDCRFVVCCDLVRYWGLQVNELIGFDARQCFRTTHLSLPGVRRTSRARDVHFSLDSHRSALQFETIQAAFRLCEAGPLLGTADQAALLIDAYKKRLRYLQTRKATPAGESSRERCFTFTHLHGEFYRHLFETASAMSVEHVERMRNAQVEVWEEVLRDSHVQCFEQVGRLRPPFRRIARDAGGAKREKTSAKWWAGRIRSAAAHIGARGIERAWVKWGEVERNWHPGTLVTVIVEPKHFMSEAEKSELARLVEAALQVQVVIEGWYADSEPARAVRINDPHLLTGGITGWTRTA